MQRKFHNIQQNTTLWHKLREGRVTSSECSTFLSGFDTKGYKSMVDRCARSQLGLKVSTKRFSNFYTEWGHRYEPEGREAWEKETGMKATNGGFATLGDLYGSSQDHYAEGTKGGGEIKCVQYEKFELICEKEECPTEYLPQIQMQMFISDLEWVDFIAYYPGLKPHIVTVHKSSRFVKRIEDRMKVFENDVQEKVIEYIFKMSNNIAA